MNVLLIDGESELSPPVSYCLAMANRTVHVGAASRFPDIRFSRFTKTFRRWNGSAHLLEQVRGVIRHRRIDVIVGCFDSAVRFLSEHKSELAALVAVAGVPSPTSCDIAADKAKFAQFLAGINLPHPETVVIRPGAPLPEALPRFPALLKPARGSGGALITRWSEPEALHAFASKGGIEGRTWILQSYIHGRNIGCSVICREGRILGYTIQSSVHVPAISFAPVGLVEFTHDDEVLSVAEKIVRELRWTGVAHLDMLRSEDDGRVYPLEMNGRYWASILGSFRAGVNFPELACLDALGKTFPAPTFRRGVRFVRGGIETAWRELHHPGDTALFWRLSDPGPMLSAYWKRALPSL